MAHFKLRSVFAYSTTVTTVIRPLEDGPRETPLSRLLVVEARGGNMTMLLEATSVFLSR